MNKPYALLARYNAEMNQRFHIAAQQLTPGQLTQNRGAFFGSILGTLNHLIVADTLWLQRLALHPSRFPSIQAAHTWPKPKALHQTVVCTLPEWAEQRFMMDDMIKKFVTEMSDKDLAGLLDYADMKGVVQKKPLADVLLHFFNHQTHHRGQVSTLLFQAGVDVGVTDLISLIPSASLATTG